MGGIETTFKVLKPRALKPFWVFCGTVFAYPNEQGETFFSHQKALGKGQEMAAQFMFVFLKALRCCHSGAYSGRSQVGSASTIF